MFFQTLYGLPATLLSRKSFLWFYSKTVFTPLPLLSFPLVSFTFHLLPPVTSHAPPCNQPCTLQYPLYPPSTPLYSFHTWNQICLSWVTYICLKRKPGFYSIHSMTKKLNSTTNTTLQPPGNLVPGTSNLETWKPGTWKHGNLEPGI